MINTIWYTESKERKTPHISHFDVEERKDSKTRF